MLLPFSSSMDSWEFNSETQSGLPLWSSGLKSLGYSPQFPTIPRTSTSTPTFPGDTMDEGEDASPQSEISGTEEEKGWGFYIGSICSRRTVNDMLIDLWRCVEQEWVNNIDGVVEKTAEAVNGVYSWYQLSRNGLPPLNPDNENIEFLLYSRYLLCLEKIYRPILYLAVHYNSLPGYLQNNTRHSYAILVSNLWYHFRHKWIWNIMRCTFGASIHIIAVVLSRRLITICQYRWVVSYSTTQLDRSSTVVYLNIESLVRGSHLTLM
ncbi:hypothetical protein N7481_012444 [Penicillium waksmanii]|uniref:uncharacterized protein n=1 Tax=Penicillium waksmanii TaxID=69791 RepID=UPI0025498F61|nr:uncharacterized protein N7481_012444 [Penicillium waksmanii]KAJ5965730.1 hypothetical protein N7481_012444 [Penicillium waksmanii]